MYPRLLITPSIVNSWNWYMNAGDEYEEQAMMDFKAALRHEKTPTTPQQQDGIDFEDHVHLVCDSGIDYQDEDEIYASCVNECAEYVRGGQWQVKVYADVTVDGQPFLAYGRVDVLKGPIIWDIKFTGKYEVGKYKDGAQASFYLGCVDGPEQMCYLVSDGKTVFTEPYLREDVRPMRSIVADFWSWLPPDLRELYVDNWKSR